jgi:hypothetical protein
MLPGLRRQQILQKLAEKQPARNEPDNPGLWGRAISEAKKRFTVYPSAYANGWAAKWYKERGGGWHKEKQATVAKKDVGHGGLDEWFSGHGKDKGRAQWGDWVSISPIRKTLKSGRVVEPGDIVGQCGISDSPDWRQYTKGGQDPLKCMPRKKALAMPKEERAALARGKARAEKSSGNTGEPVMTRTFSKLAGSKVAARFPDSPANLPDDLPHESGYSYTPPPPASVLTPAAQKILEYRAKQVEMGRPTSINPQQFLRAKYEKVPGGAEQVVARARAAGSPIMWGNLNREVPILQAPSAFGARADSVAAEYSYDPRVPRVPEAITYERRERGRDPSTIEHELNHAINMNLGDAPNPGKPTLPSRARPRSMEKSWFEHDVSYPESQAEYFSRAKGGLANARGFVSPNRQQARTELAEFVGQPPYTPVQGPGKTMRDQSRANFLSTSPLWGEEGSAKKPPVLNMLDRYPGLLTRTL